MCGIAGFFGSDTTDLFNTPELLRELLEGIEHRGREATGVSWWGADNDKPAAVWPMLLKAPMAATQFVHEYEATLSDAANTNLVIAHTRLPTQGDKRHAVNNHPIDHGLIVGVHNGCVYNDAEIFRQLNCDRFG